MINGMHACNGACQPMHCAVKTNDMAWVSMSISWSFKSSEQKLDILAALSTQYCQKAWQSHFLDPSWQKGGYSAARYKFDIREWFLNFFGQTQQHHRRKSKACCCNFKLLQYFRCDHSIREANGTWNIYESHVPSRGELPPMCLVWARCNSANGYQQILVHQRLREAVLKFAKNVADIGWLYLILSHTWVCLKIIHLDLGMINMS